MPLSNRSSYIYAGLGRKPQLLINLENYVNKELHTISPQDPKYQELKLQVYRDVFGHVIKEFKTYQPLLSAIKREYENTLAYQQDQIRGLEPLQSRLRLVTEECERKIQARWGEEQAEIGALKREKQQLQKAIEAMGEKEKAMQAVVERLQYELSNQYLQYREERDARKLLIWQLSDLRSSVKEVHSVDASAEEAKDPVEVQLALKVCREDLTKTQEELNRTKAKYWDVVPRRNWDILEETQKQTLLQLKTLQNDFDQLKSEYDTLLELHKRGSMQAEIHESTAVQAVSYHHFMHTMDTSVFLGQKQTESSQLKDPDNPDYPENGTSNHIQENRAASPLKPHEETDVLVTLVQSEPDRSNDIISSQRPNSLLAEAGVAVLPPALDQSEENTASNIFPLSS
ncbi:translin-associated factor X-interacting protein 1 [Echeneis naucrates]|uniref:translin-associated factor X-interacting protein 1 n=1 Tax=Echeneis naucrates TaxID=173247 RepID=UPI00111376E1|nr:translin-associated factor X-interacting protein 1 [Echeneis naucrates]